MPISALARVVSSRQHSSRTPRRRRDRLQRLALLRGHRRCRFPPRCRRQANARDRPLLGECRAWNAARGRYELRGVIGPDEFPRRLPGRDQTRGRQQRLHQSHGGLVHRARLGALCDPSGRTLPAALRDLHAGEGRARSMGGRQPQDVRAVPRRRNHQPVRRLRGARRTGTGPLIAAGTATSSASISSWRPRRRRPTPTSCRSRRTS